MLTVIVGCVLILSFIIIFVKLTHVVGSGIFNYIRKIFRRYFLFNSINKNAPLNIRLLSKSWVYFIFVFQSFIENFEIKRNFYIFVENILRNVIG
jgi:hypothetical protein